MPSVTTALRGFFVALALGVFAVVSSGCTEEVDAAYPDGYYDADYPPDAYVDTAEPIYYEGHASYWYGNRWYYRDGPHWRYYHHEPVVLRERRVHGYGRGYGARGFPHRRVYERAAPRHYSRGGGVRRGRR